jgi:hypothetical protein
MGGQPARSALLEKQKKNWKNDLKKEEYDDKSKNK